MLNIKNSLWVEKYRPQRVKDIIMPSEYHRYFSQMIESKECLNLLLCSNTPGTGKTTLAKALAEDLEADYLYINASSDNGIAVAREQIAEYASAKSFDKRKKIVILDEADGLTEPFQRALRGYIEQYSANCRFILTCNYISKIIPALQEGRTNFFDFNLMKKEYINTLTEKMVSRLAGILKNEKIEYDAVILPKLVESLYPSLRKMISVLQKYAALYGKIDSGILSFKAVDTELAEYIKAKNITAARNYINSNGFCYTDVFSFILESYVPNMAKKGQAILILAQYEFQCATTTMPDLQIAAALIEIMNLE